MNTSHGHHILGTCDHPSDQKLNCGGPFKCPVCSAESKAVKKVNLEKFREVFPDFEDTPSVRLKREVMADEYARLARDSFVILLVPTKGEK